MPHGQQSISASSDYKLPQQQQHRGFSTEYKDNTIETDPVLNKHNTVKVRSHILNRISELVVKKQLNDEKDPFKKIMTSKESLLEDNKTIEEALEYQQKYPFRGVDAGLANLQDANGRIRHSLSQINALDSNRSPGNQAMTDNENNWVGSFDPDRESYNQRVV